MRQRSPLAAILVAAVAGAVGIRMWVDSRSPGGSDEPTDAFRPHVERQHVGSPPEVARPGDGLGLADVDPAASHIGDPLDPDAEHVRTHTEVRHIGNFLNPDDDYRAPGDQRAVHIGISRDPDDDWRPLPHTVVRHIGEPLEPDLPPIGDPTVAHIGAPLDLPGED